MFGGINLCYFVAILFGVGIPVLIFKIKFWEQSARVIELEKKLTQLENEYYAEQELKLAKLEKNFIMGKNCYEKTMRTLNYIKDKQIKLIQKSENYKNKLEQEIENSNPF